METPDLVTWILCGAIAGLLGEAILRRHQESSDLMMIAIGILGAFGGGLLAHVAFAEQLPSPLRMGIAIMGAVAVVGIIVLTQQGESDDEEVL